VWGKKRRETNAKRSIGERKKTENIRLTLAKSLGEWVGHGGGRKKRGVLLDRKCVGKLGTGGKKAKYSKWL